MSVDKDDAEEVIFGHHTLIMYETIIVEDEVYIPILSASIMLSDSYMLMFNEFEYIS